MSNPMIRKLQKMLALATDRAGTPEGETAARLAHKLLREAGLTMADVAGVDNTPDPIQENVFRVAAATWRRSLWASVARFCGCDVFYTTGTKRLVVVGRKSDAEVAEYLVGSFIAQLDAELRQYKREHPWGTRSDWNSWRRSAASGVASKLRKLTEDARAEDAQGTALVVSRRAQARAWMDEHYNLSKGRTSRYNYNSAGYNAGTRVSLRAGVGGSSPRQIG